MPIFYFILKGDVHMSNNATQQPVVKVTSEWDVKIEEIKAKSAAERAAYEREIELTKIQAESKSSLIKTIGDVAKSLLIGGAIVGAAWFIGRSDDDSDSDL